LLEVGNPNGEVRNAWHAKEVVRSIYDIEEPKLASEFVAQLGIDLQDESCPLEARRLGRTIIKWRHQIAAWHQARFTNTPVPTQMRRAAIAFHDDCDSCEYIGASSTWVRVVAGVESVGS
jgi:Transposase